MTCEALLLAIADAAPNLSSVGLRLLLKLLALSIEQGSNEVRIAHRDLAAAIGSSKEGVAMGIRNLATLVTVDVRPGRAAAFTLPLEWFSPQRSLFAVAGARPQLLNCPGFQDATVLETRTPLSWKLGHTRPKNQDNCPGIQDTSALKTRTTVLASRTDLSHYPGQFDDSPIRNAHARVESNRISGGAPSGFTVDIDSMLRTVEIAPSQRQDAEILSESLMEYRSRMGGENALVTHPDEKVIARILTIAPLEELCGVLRRLLDDRVPCGKNDMWFFTVLLQRIHGISPQLTRARYDALKTRKPPISETLPGFSNQLVRDVAAGTRISF